MITNKIKVLITLGTRPEGIKLAPVIKKLKDKKDKFDCKVCSTGQHRQMLKQVLDFFEIKPDYNLNLMEKNQSLNSLSSKLISKIDTVISDFSPDIILVQGDTTTAFLTALSAFYKKIKVGHVEAGLRTYDKYNPFPEEVNRQLITRVSNLHFVPTEKSFNNLLNEKVSREDIYLTGNTIVDAITWGIKKIEKNRDNIESKDIFKKLNSKSKVILVTMHRRESFGEDITNACNGLKTIANKYRNVQIVCPVHLNPNVQGPVFKILKGIDNIILTKPLDYRAFLWLMERSYFIVTDSGGIQEEAPTLKKPVLVIRKKTERTESVKLGISKLVGTRRVDIVNNISRLLDNNKIYKSMVSDKNPYGDGKASDKILKAIESKI